MTNPKRAFKRQDDEIDRLRAVNADLIAALEAMTTLFGPDHNLIETDAAPRICEQARAAIARATGGAK